MACLWVIASIFLLFQNTALAETEKPRLILQITVDQLRGDLPARFLDRMGEGGFRYFFEEGIVYGNAHHAHANTETIVGHATLATGAHPSAHGMIGNIWFDRDALKDSEDRKKTDPPGARLHQPDLLYAEWLGQDIFRKQSFAFPI